jgi:hypothetical protein
MPATRSTEGPADPSRKGRAMLRSMNDLQGFTIGATDGDIGRVDAFYFDDTSFTVRHIWSSTPAAG